jgi:serine/threonine protein kinase
VACIVLGLEYIHENKFIHRDIKPENLVLDEKGYLRITDFGVAKISQRENSSETSGTPGYMAPEVMCAQNHSFAVDFFALGVIAYEFMLGIRPYLGRSRKEIKEMILAKQVQIKMNDKPNDWSIEAVEFINAVYSRLFKLLQRKPHQRLGYNGIKELKNHPWFAEFNWNDLMQKKIPAPFIPRLGDNFDKKYCEGIDKFGQETLERYQNHYKRDNFENIFPNYTFYGDLIQKEKQRVQSRLQMHRNSITEKLLTKTISSSSIVVPKKKLTFVDVNSNSNLMKITHSPLPANKGLINTPVTKHRSQRTAISSISSTSLIKFNTPIKCQDNSTTKSHKLPTIETQIQKAKTTHKKTLSKNSTSLDTGSTNNTFMHRRTLSSFTNKNLK